MPASTLEFERVEDFHSLRKIGFNGKQYFIRLPKKLVELLERRGIYCGRYGHAFEIDGVYEMRKDFERKYCVLLVFS